MGNESKVLFLIVFVVYNSTLSAQSLDNFKNQKPLLLNGFISTNQVINTQPTDSINITNYTSYYTGSLNFSIYGINVPLTFMYSNNQASFNLPFTFNQFSMHPSYKWIKAHLGYASMNFSPYTLNGHLFLGSGVEVDPPGLFYGSVVYGRLRKAINYDTLNFNQTPSYKRMGYGFKLGIAKNGDFVDVSMFKSYDIENSIDNISTEKQILPQENSALSISYSLKVIPKLFISGELASSYLTKDTRTEKISKDKVIIKPAIWFMPLRSATINRNAIKSTLTYQHNRFTVGLGYERVDPEYQTLGAYYFNNNMENMTINFSFNLLKNKLSIGGNTGLQKDNLDKSKLNSSERLVNSYNINYIPNEKLNFNLAYSNFTSYTNIRSTFDYINETDEYQNLDTLNFRQISQNTNFGGSYQLGNSKKLKQTLNWNFTWQASNNEQTGDVVDLSNFYNTNFSYLVNITSIGLTCNASINYNKNEVGIEENQTLGPVIGLNKLFLNKKLRTSITTSYSKSKSEKSPSSSIFNIRTGLAYNLKKKHNFNTNLLFQRRKSISKSSYALNFTFGYTYNFDIISQ